MKSNDYEERICECCGKVYKPGRRDQRTCGSYDCKMERQRRNMREWATNNRDRKREIERRYKARKRERNIREPKPDTIVAIGYAERQIAASLAKAGKVKVEL